jgi:hypothetical protein
MIEADNVRWRIRRTLAVGTVCIVAWVATLQIKGSAVFYYLERFALHDDGRYLLASATTLVSLNTLRAVFLYVGWFNLGHSLSHLSNRWRRFSWLVPLAGVPCCYTLLSQVQGGLSLHFGAPAVFSIVTVVVMQMTTREIKGWIARLVVIALLVFAVQWLDLAPMLSDWGFGGGELSSAVKEFALVADWGDVWFINGQPLADVKALIDDVGARHRRWGRPLRLGLSAFVIARDTAHEAKEHLDYLFDLATKDAAVRAVQRANTDPT